ncbi:hypothetical protein EXIGLDRAFT_834743 [Exidia glandulosa HHB12029]|uniref:F-box domain-containing protein n=1 Tax=Exidia glandulosa HHB12029 TaxID=1314781 RepID=A0A165JFJ0_EXIGL|nr:hypothetical protein EXIGLDRAFT_834743 [Exidia glandulosa HHB12029]
MSITAAGACALVPTTSRPAPTLVDLPLELLCAVYDALGSDIHSKIRFMNTCRGSRAQFLDYPLGHSIFLPASMSFDDFGTCLNHLWHHRSGTTQALRSVRVFKMERLRPLMLGDPVGIGRAEAHHQVLGKALQRVIPLMPNLVALSLPAEFYKLVDDRELPIANLEALDMTFPRRALGWDYAVQRCLRRGRLQVASESEVSGPRLEYVAGNGCVIKDGLVFGRTTSYCEVEVKGDCDNFNDNTMLLMFTNIILPNPRLMPQIGNLTMSLDELYELCVKRKYVQAPLVVPNVKRMTLDLTSKFAVVPLVNECTRITDVLSIIHFRDVKLLTLRRSGALGRELDANDEIIFGQEAMLWKFCSMRSLEAILDLWYNVWRPDRRRAQFVIP